MMGTAVLYYIRSLWPFSTLKTDDLRVSDGLVRGLEIPDETKLFVFAIREPESQAVIYILSAQNLSERSALDAEHLIRCVRPGAVVVQVNQVESEDVSLCGGSGNDGDHSIPTSSLEVLRRCFLHKINKEKYENVAGSLVLKEIFGVGFNEHLSAAKRISEEVGSSFLLLDSGYVKLETKSNPSSDVESSNNFQSLGLQPSNLVPQKLGSIVPPGTRRYFISEDYVHSQMLKSLCSYFGQLSSNQKMGSVDIQPKDDYEAPQYARSVYPLLSDLHNIFLEIPSIGRALAHAQKMLHDVNKGNPIDTQLLSEVYAFQVAVEGLRIALNNAGRIPISKMGRHHSVTTEFSALPDEDKSHALLAHALRSQTKNFKSIVAVIDASILAGLRKNWNTPVPAEFKNTVEELVADSTKEGEAANNNDMRRGLTSKPVVAVGAGATAVLGASSLSKVVPASTFVKAVTFKVPASMKLVLTQTHKLISICTSKVLGPSKMIGPGMKAAASAEKVRTVVHSIIASAEKTSFSAVRTAFYEIMRKRQVRPVGVLPWATFGCSVATCTSLLVYGDGIECAVESLPAASSIASLGRGIESLHEASQAVRQAESSRIQKSIESLIKSFKRWKIAQ